MADSPSHNQPRNLGPSVLQSVLPPLRSQGFSASHSLAIEEEVSESRGGVWGGIAGHGETQLKGEFEGDPNVTVQEGLGLTTLNTVIAC